MTAADAMRGIETDRFAALTNLASNLKTFLRIAAAQPEVQALSRTLASDSDVASQVLHRPLELSAVSLEADREHAADAALAVYLWLLSDRPTEFAQLAAAILSEPVHFFWARKVAHGSPPPNGLAKGDGKGGKVHTPGEVTEGGISSRIFLVDPREAHNKQ
jgi:hypothetical protein